MKIFINVKSWISNAILFGYSNLTASLFFLHEWLYWLMVWHLRLSNALQKSSDFVCVFSGDVLCGHSSILPPCHFLCHPMEEGQIKQNTNPSTNQEQDQNGQKPNNSWSLIGLNAEWPFLFLFFLFPCHQEKPFGKPEFKNMKWMNEWEKSKLLINVTWTLVWLAEWQQFGQNRCKWNAWS